MYRPVDVRRHQPPHDGADEPHQSFGFAKFAAPDRLHDHHKRVVNLVVEFLAPQLAAKVVAYPLEKQLIELLHAVSFPAPDSLHQDGPRVVGFIRAGMLPGPCLIPHHREPPAVTTNAPQLLAGAPELIISTWLRRIASAGGIVRRCR